MKRFITLGFLCLLVFVAYGQNNYVKGYIVTEERDTCMGYVDFRRDMFNAESCRFKTELDSEPTIYLPGEIEAYRFLDEKKYYVSRNIDIENAPSIVFLECLVQGEMNLYFYKNRAGKEYFFFENKDGKLISIDQNPEEIEGNIKKIDLRYQRMLNRIFKDEAEMQKDIRTSEFNRSSMIKLTRQYHELTCISGEECIVFENDYTKNYLDLNFGFYVGTLRSMHLNALAPVFSDKTTPLFGVQLEIKSLRFSRDFGVLVDVSGTHISGEYKNWKNKMEDWSITNFNIGVGAKYTYPTGSIRPVAEAGLVGRLFFGDESVQYYGVSAALGCDIPVNKSNAFMLRVGYDYTMYIGNIFSSDNYPDVQSLCLKAGYIF